MSKISHPVESTRASGIISLKVLKTRLVQFLLITYEPCLTIFDQFVHSIVLLQSLTFIFCRRRKGNKKSKSRLSSNDEGEKGYELSIKNEAFVGEDIVDAVQPQVENNSDFSNPIPDDDDTYANNESKGGCKMACFTSFACVFLSYFSIRSNNFRLRLLFYFNEGVTMRS